MDFDAQFFVETMLNGTLTPGAAIQAGSGEVLSPYPGEFRLESDFLIARYVLDHPHVRPMDEQAGS